MIKKMIIAGVLGCGLAQATTVHVCYNDDTKKVLLDTNNSAVVCINEDVTVRIKDVRTHEDGLMEVDCAIDLKGVEHAAPSLVMTAGEPVVLTCGNEESQESLMIKLDSDC